MTSKRTFTTTRTLTVTAAPGRSGKVTFKEGADLDYVFNEANGIFQHDADQLFDMLRATLPAETWTALVRRMRTR